MKSTTYIWSWEQLYITIYRCIIMQKRCRNCNNCLFKKNIDICLDWNAFAPVSWKRSPLRTLAQRAYVIYSTETYLKEELTYLGKVFIEKKNYHKYVIKQIFMQLKEEHINKNYSSNMENKMVVPIILENKNEKQHSLTIFILRWEEDYSMKSLKRNLKKILPN